MRRVELVTAARMRGIEAAAMASGEVTGLALMERAGAACVDAVADEWPDLGPGSTAVVVCGPGNNGGDGFVIARLLHDAGWTVRVLAMPSVRRGPDAAAARRAAKAAGLRAVPLTYDGFRGGADADLYVDALFGTGARGPATGEVGDLMRYWAGSGGDYGHFQPRTLAVDLPSGLDADSGRVPGVPDPFGSPTPHARLTVTFDSPKPGHLLGHGPDLCGRVVVADIGVARWREGEAFRGGPMRKVTPVRTGLLSAEGPSAPLPSPWQVPEGRPPLGGARPFAKGQGHKYDHGHALVLSGGVGRGGAARLAARGALRVGAGAVTLGCPPAAVPENACRLDAVMIARIADGDALRAALEDGRLTALCLGMGLGSGGRERDLVAAALGAGRATVLDADALRMLGEDADLRGRLHPRCLLTPHMGEFRALCPDLADRLSPTRPAAPDDADAAGPAARAEERAPMYSKIDAARDAAARLGCAVLLKGPDTVVAEPDGRAHVVASVGPHAVPDLATAGAGDVLAGIAAGLMARGWPPGLAGAQAAWLHAAAARGFGPGLIAEDLPDRLPAVLRALS
ncbi:NAD(P)H-hydrate epimerase [Jannaschia sp. Os4]|uniref:NAD(P)H-hydrate epimerase n=1 Tax=Jannaschia sp. Os4 TaxID=2807617 RepID=UPI001939E918|nr:NAD(P)H-hydrate epimerase [Jannaschia sp. Os4]MBM2577633.1 NAD(P)H-hydrate epimerase [Jannaschia sp. Os4]